MLTRLYGLLIEAAILFLVGFVVERMLVADKNNSVRNIALNSMCGVLYYLGMVSLSTLIFVKITQIVKLIPFHVLDLSRINDHGHWFQGILITFLVLVPVRDFFYYWMHRLQHYSPWLWAEHAVHHSDEHMNVTTAVRHHWLETSLESIFVTAPIFALFRLPVTTSLAAYLVMHAYGSFVHLNSPINLGPLNRIFANPSTHRIHHSREAQHMDKNFAPFFPLWDVLFGTYCEPQRGIVPATGLNSDEKISSIGQAIIFPFQQWVRMMSEKKYKLNESPEPQLTAQR